MNRAIALVAPASAATGRLVHLDLTDWARSLIVLGSAAALILAQQPLPF
jgi:hypothetical protein